MCALITALSVLSAPGISDAADISPNILYRDEPIDPLCFDNGLVVTRPEGAWVDLDKCLNDAGVSVENVIPQKTGPLTPNENGFIGYDFTMGDSEFPSSGMALYKYVGPITGGFVIQTIYNTGGTGFFSSLNIIERQNGRIHIARTLAGGDRCNGGIRDARIEDGKVHFSVNITPADIIYGYGGAPESEAYDIEVSAASCFAEALYTDGTFTSIVLNGDIFTGVDDPAVDNGFADQPCFNKVFGDYLSSGRGRLTPEQVKTFTADFRRECPVRNRNQ